MITLYGIPNCNTVKKAQKWLEDRKIEYRFHNFRADGLDKSKVESWLDQQPVDKLVNKASTSFRALTDEEKSEVLTRAGALKIVTEVPTLIKRPVVEDEKGQVLSIGFREAEYEELFVKLV